MVAVEVATGDDVVISVGGEDVLEWKIVTSLTARDWCSVDVSEG